MADESMSTVEKAIELLEKGAAELKKNPFALENVMNEINVFWGIETGRIDPDEDFENY